MVAVILGSAASATDRPISVLRHVDCERQCPYYYFPICATNGNPKENRMFVNFCEMQAWNCDAKKSEQNLQLPFDHKLIWDFCLYRVPPHQEQSMQGLQRVCRRRMAWFPQTVQKAKTFHTAGAVSSTCQNKLTKIARAQHLDSSTRTTAPLYIIFIYLFKILCDIWRLTYSKVR